jgi:hypothetical protein
MDNKEIIKKLYNEYKSQFLNELYDTPLNFKRDNNSYVVFKENGDELAFFTFRFEYNISDSPVNYKKYKLDKYWDVNWYWSSDLDEKEKNTKSFIKVTSTAFKIIYDFIKDKNYPLLLGFGGLTNKHENIYSNELFIDRWKNLLGEKYYVEWKNNKLWIINKIIYKIDEAKIYKASQAFKKDTALIFQEEKFPIKSKLKGINKHNFIKEQIKRIILKQIYIK